MMLSCQSELSLCYNYYHHVICVEIDLWNVLNTVQADKNAVHGIFLWINYLWLGDMTILYTTSLIIISQITDYANYKHSHSNIWLLKCFIECVSNVGILQTNYYPTCSQAKVVVWTIHWLTHQPAFLLTTGKSLQSHSSTD